MHTSHEIWFLAQVHGSDVAPRGLAGGALHLNRRQSDGEVAVEVGEIVDASKLFKPDGRDIVESVG